MKNYRFIGARISPELWQRVTDQVDKERNATHIYVKLSDIVRKALTEYMERVGD